MEILDIVRKKGILSNCFVNLGDFRSIFSILIPHYKIQDSGLVFHSNIFFIIDNYRL